MSSENGRSTVSGGSAVRSRLLLLGVAGVLASLVVACGPAAPTTGSYVAEFSNGAAYLAWTRTDTSVSGNFSQAIWRDGDTALTNEAFNVTGTADGNSISLKLDEGLGLGPTGVGTFNGDRLTLTFPSTNGKVNQYVFRPGTQADYAGLVATVQSQIDAANAAAEAERAAAEEQARRDAAVQNASAALGNAIDALSSNADVLEGSAANMASAVEHVAGSIDDGMQLAYERLRGWTQVQPMDDVAQGNVCVALGDVEVARGDVDVAVGDVEVAEDPYKSALSDRSGYVSAVQAAVTDLNAAVAADEGGVSPQYAATDAGARLSSAASTAKAAATKADKAKADVASLVKSADALMSKARKLAATVASC